MFSTLHVLPGANSDGVNGLHDGDDEIEDSPPVGGAVTYGRKTNDAQKSGHENAPPQRHRDHSPAKKNKKKGGCVGRY